LPVLALGFYCTSHEIEESIKTEFFGKIFELRI